MAPLLTGLWTVDGGFELLSRGVAVGPRRHLDEEAVRGLQEFSDRTVNWSIRAMLRPDYWHLAVIFLSGWTGMAEI
jgi:hypothetical protein